MPELTNILTKLTEGRELPEGCDRWALKATDFGGRTRGGFQWPDHGWVSCHAPDPTNTGPCPIRDGDGVCVGLTFAGIAQGGHRALALMLVAYATADVLGEDTNKVRLDRAFVMERLDGEQVLRHYGRGANLRGANLWGANLWDADLWGANLQDANFRGANLRGANLWDADLRGANLQDANLQDANLRGANLRGANLRGAKVDPTSNAVTP